MSAPLPRAIQLVNSGEGISLAEWAQITAACQQTLERVGLHDQAVDAAVAVGRILRGQKLESVLPLHPLTRDVLSVAHSDVEGHVRGTLGMVTHAARSAGLPAHVDTLLAGVEAQALSRAAEPTEISSMLAKWPNTLASMQRAGSLHPTMALGITHIQAQILQDSTELLDRVQVPPNGLLDRARFRAELQASRDAWQAARSELMQQPTVGMTPDQVRVARSVSVLSAELRDSLRTQTLVPAAERFDTLMRAEQAGNLRVAVMVAQVVGNPDTRQQLISAANDLQMATSTILANTRGSLVDEPETKPAPAMTTPNQAPAAPALVTAPRPAVDVPEVPTPDTAALSAEAALELARRRDTGVVAAASLEGDPQAVALTKGVSPAELGRLVEDGRQACGQLMASVVPMIRWRLQGRSLNDREECFASIAAELATAAHKWNPTRSGWPGFALRTIDWGLANYWRQASGHPIPVVMATDADRGQRGVLHPDRLTDPAPMPEESAQISIDAARAAYLMSRLAYPKNVIVQSVLGVGEEPTTTAAVARRLGMPHTTVRRYYKQGIATLRSQMGVGRDD